MPHICLNSPLPTIESIIASFSPYLTYPPGMPGMPSLHLPDFHLPPFPGIPKLNIPPFPGIPQLPSFVLNFLGLPNPLFGSMHLPNIEFTTIAIHLQSFQLQNTIMNMVKPMLSFLGLSLSSFFPSIPGLPGFTLIDLISGEVTALIAALKAAIAAKFKFPWVPDPIYGSLTMPSVAVPHILMSLTTNYLNTLVNLVFGLIKSVTDKLKIPAMPALPVMPSFEEIFNSLKAAIAAKLAGIHLPNLSLNLPKFPGFDMITLPKLPSFPGMPGLPSLNLASLLSMLTFPGFPNLPALPDPLIPTFNVPNINVQLGLTVVINNMITSLLAKIMEFIMNVLSKFIGFSFPKICIDL